MICRFLVGFGGAAPLAIVGGGLADMFDPITRGAAVLIFAAATFMGPLPDLLLEDLSRNPTSVGGGLSGSH